MIERRRIATPFEERAVDRASLEHLNLEWFQSYLERRFGPEDEPPAASLEMRLINLKLAERSPEGRLAPTVLGLLLFGRPPVTRFLPGAFVDCVCFKGLVADANHQPDAKTFNASLAEQIADAVRFIERWTPVAAQKTHEGRKDFPAFSLRAAHEAVVNALVHRDYQLFGSNVRVFIFDDRIEISNPGGLHNTLRSENLFAGCQPYRRNQLLCGFLRDFISPITERALMEARGEDFLMMVRETRRLGGDVEFVQHPDAVTVILKAARP